MNEKKELTLLIMAAGMGSRFGGLKQIEPIGPSGEFLTDYSIYDASLAGIKKIVFIIKKENLEIFQNTIEKRINGKVPVEYVFQEKELVVNGKTYKREKPWGTGHAILAAKDQIKGDFLIINADDFYGREAYQDAMQFFKSDRKPNEFALIGYKTANTLSENGSAKRGICYAEDGKLKKLLESSVERIDGKIVAKPLNGSEAFTVEDDTLVSMNMFLFTPYIFELLENQLPSFIETNKEALETAEFLIPDVVEKAREQNKITVKVIETNAKWEGVTYLKDKEIVVSAIQKLIHDGSYSENLWQ